MAERERKFESVPHDFTEAEIAGMKEKLIVKLGEMWGLKEQKASMVATVNLQIRTVEKEAQDLHRKLEAGSEMIELEVTEIMNEPRPGWKKIVQIDNMDNVIREVPMSPRELQQRLFSDLPETAE